MYGGSYGTVNPSAEYARLGRRLQLFRLRRLPAERPWRQRRHIEIQPDPRRDAAGPRLRLSRQDHRPEQPDQRDVRRVQLAVSDPEQSRASPTFGGISAINGMPISAFNSAQLNELQTEGSQFGAVSYLHSEGDFDFQVSAITKYSSLNYHPDTVGRSRLQRHQRERGADQLGQRPSGRGHLPADERPHAARRPSRQRRACDGQYELRRARPDRHRHFRQPDLRDDNDKHRRTAARRRAIPTAPISRTNGKCCRHVTVNYGGRFDVVNGYTIGNQLSPRLNTVWKPTPSTTVHAGYAELFHAAAAGARLDRKTSPSTRTPARHPRVTDKFAAQERERAVFRRWGDTGGRFPASRWASIFITNTRATCSTKDSSARRSSSRPSTTISASIKASSLTTSYTRREFHLLWQSGDRQAEGIGH